MEKNDRTAVQDIDPEIGRRRATALIVKTLGFSRMSDDDHLEALFSALSRDRRRSVIQLLEDWFIVSEALRERLEEALDSARDLARIVWRETDVVDEPPGDEDGNAIRLREGRSIAAFTKSYRRWVRRTAEGIPAEEANFDSFRGAAERLAELFGLSEAEREVLLAIYAYDNVPNAEEIEPRQTVEGFVRMLSRVSGVPLTESRQALRKDGSLAELKLIEQEGFDASRFEPSAIVSDFLDGMTSEALLQRSVREQAGPTFSVSSFPIPEADRHTATALIAGGEPRHMLLYGAPGAGKTELARTLVKKSGRRGLWIEATEDDRHSSTERFALIRVGARMASRQNAVLVIDEADALLNTESETATAGKATVVRMLDEIGVTTVWITNSADELHSAVQRRFAYSLAFDPPKEAVRYNRLSEALREQGVRLAPAQRREMARLYDVSLGSVTRAVETAAELALVGQGEDDPQRDTASAKAPADHGRAAHRVEDSEFLRHLEVILAREHELLHGLPAQRSSFSDGRATPVSLILDAINTDVSVERIMEVSDRFFKARERSGRAAGGLNMLFSGVSGTGKTAFAEELARRLGRKLHIATGSNLLDMYVGQSEQNVAALFARAERNDEIILLDEAENLLQKRNSARHGFERQLTNEFLYRLERHNTICIATTNEQSIMDDAMHRRFSFKVTFRPPAAEHRVQLYRAYFTMSHRRLTAKLKDRVRAIDGLTPGAVRTVYDRVRWVLEDGITHEEIIEALDAEVRTAGAPREPVVMGFTA